MPRTLVHRFSTGSAGTFTTPSPPPAHDEGMGDFLVIVGIVIFTLAMIGLIKGLERL